LNNGELITTPFSHPVGWRRWRISQLLFQATVHRDPEFFELNRAILMRFLALSREQNFEPVAIFLPGVADTAVDQKRRAFVRQWTVQNEVPYLDLTDAIHGPGIEETFIENNWHWNAEGHRIAAVELRGLLIGSQELLRDAPASDVQPIHEPSPSSAKHCRQLSDETGG